MSEMKKIWRREDIPVEHTWATEDLYVSDGVHLSDLGGILVSDEILKYFAEEFK